MDGTSTKEKNHHIVESSLQRFLDDLDGPADLQMALQHGRCQMVYKIVSDDLDGK
jgi:hypothetical protein